MTARREVFVVVPAFNEAPRIGAVLRSLLPLRYSIVVVDDGSDDGTWNEARSYPVWTLRHPVNLGTGAARQTGTTFALRRGARFVVWFDADGQHDPADIDAVLEPLRSGEVDFVTGSRFLRKEDRRQVPLARRAVLRAGVAVNGLLTGVWLTDAHHGLRAMTREAAERVHLVENRFAYATEVLQELRRYGLRIAERPVAVTYSRESLAKGQSGWNALNIVLDVITGRILR